MKLVIAVTSALAFLMSAPGCGSTAMMDEPERGSFFLVSQGEASLIYKILGGGVSYCKVTQYNLGGSEYDVSVSWDGDRCVVDGVANGPQ